MNNKENITMAMELPTFVLADNTREEIKIKELSGLAERFVREYTIQKDIKFYEEWLKYYSDDELRNLYRVLEALMGERGLI